MTRPVLVKAFLEGASLATLAELLGHDLHDLEAGLRMGLIGIQTAEAEPPAERAVTEGNPSPRKAPEAGASSPRPARRKSHAAQLAASPVRKRIAAKIGDALDLTGYPESLQDPRAETQRKVYDALRNHTGTTVMLAERTGMTSANLSTTLQALRGKNLVIGSETTPVIWRLA